MINTKLKQALARVGVTPNPFSLTPTIEVSIMKKLFSKFKTLFVRNPTVRHNNIKFWVTIDDTELNYSQCELTGLLSDCLTCHYSTDHGDKEFIQIELNRHDAIALTYGDDINNVAERFETYLRGLK